MFTAVKRKQFYYYYYYFFFFFVYCTHLTTKRVTVDVRVRIKTKRTCIRRLVCAYKNTVPHYPRLTTRRRHLLFPWRFNNNNNDNNNNDNNNNDNNNNGNNNYTIIAVQDYSESFRRREAIWTLASVLSPSFSTIARDGRSSSYPLHNDIA